MKNVLLILGLFVLPALGLVAQSTFALQSPAYSGKPEVGFDSKLVSAGRADPAYNEDVSLPFKWSGLPAGTKALAVIYDDPDARLVMKSYGITGTSWIHWLVTDLDPSLGGLPAGASTSAKLIQGTNGGGEQAYGGPQPPADVPADAKRPIVHVYRLTVYALSAPTKLKAGFSTDDLKKAIANKTLGTAQLLLSWSN